MDRKHWERLVAADRKTILLLPWVKITRSASVLIDYWTYDLMLDIPKNRIWIFLQLRERTYNKYIGHSTYYSNLKLSSKNGWKGPIELSIRSYVLMEFNDPLLISLMPGLREEAIQLLKNPEYDLKWDE